MSFYLQMGNLGSEVSRALELFDLTIEVANDDESASREGKLKEVCRAREEFCDYFLGNSWGTDVAKMMRYYDQFAVRGAGAVVW